MTPTRRRSPAPPGRSPIDRYGSVGAAATMWSPGRPTRSSTSSSPISTSRTCSSSCKRPKCADSPALPRRDVLPRQDRCPASASPVREIPWVSLTLPAPGSYSRDSSERQKKHAMTKRILVIDSDESFANVLAAAISKSGLVPLTATNSEHGMTLAKQETPDLIVVCVEAQPTNGYMLCTRLKKDEKLKSIPVILTSANATPDSFEKHKKLKTRAEDSLIKPFPPAALMEKASQLLGIEMSTGEAAEDDESLGLGNLVPEGDEPIRLTDDDVRNAGPMDDAVLVDDVEEVVQLESVPEGDDDLEMFDQAFES